MATVVLRDLVGLAASSREGTKLGKVKDVISDPDSSFQCLVIGHRFGRSLVVPAEVVETSGDQVVVPFSSSYLDMAPKVAAKGTPSPQDCERIRQFFNVPAA